MRTPAVLAQPEQVWDLTVAASGCHDVTELARRRTAQVTGQIVGGLALVAMSLAVYDAGLLLLG
jgi:hypothetical protein